MKAYQCDNYETVRRKRRENLENQNQNFLIKCFELFWINFFEIFWIKFFKIVLNFSFFYY